MGPWAGWLWFDCAEEEDGEEVRRAKAVHYVHHKEAVEDARLVRLCSYQTLHRRFVPARTSILMDRDSSAQKIAATTAAVMLRKATLQYRMNIAILFREVAGPNPECGTRYFETYPMFNNLTAYVGREPNYFVIFIAVALFDLVLVAIGWLFIALDMSFG
ncbi:hypothetical protein AK812_SmicGene9244 [Symbiodinium microadriaticum]|uniref:Uncharacterized protein n=1 Tax=Symbiodinium microadriaticum TaxID=2951 RepID=A0A1Q9EJ18_SYMMI|nr:hypothetical protein AK812_SmicGene9244 [Symbiodinium microadriaticum]